MDGIKTLLLLEVKNHSIDHESPEDKENAGQHPNLDCSEALSLGGIGVDIVENVDEDKEEGDEQSHAARYNVWRNQEGYP